MVVLVGNSSINGPFSMAMLNNQRVLACSLSVSHDHHYVLSMHPKEALGPFCVVKHWMHCIKKIR